jgi:hypothetical protein
MGAGSGRATPVVADEPSFDADRAAAAEEDAVDARCVTSAGAGAEARAAPR